MLNIVRMNKNIYGGFFWNFIFFKFIIMIMFFVIFMIKMIGDMVFYR